MQPGNLNEVLAAGGTGVGLKIPDIVVTSGTATQIILPTADPKVVGALWNNTGTVTVSAG